MKWMEDNEPRNCKTMRYSGKGQLETSWRRKEAKKMIKG